ncbi:MAG: cytochrome c biogenesis protein CcsA [Flavobacteriaceae bacterium]
MNRLYKIFSSSKLALVLLLAYAVAMASATFIENDYGIATSWAVVYDAWWFELIQVGLGACFVANIFKYKLLNKRKWPILLFHISFIIILIGSGITRYFSYGGIMRIREGAQSNIVISNTKFLNATYLKGDQEIKASLKKAFSPISNNNFEQTIDLNGEELIISYVDYIMDAVPEVVDDEAGNELLTVVVSTGQGRNTLYLEKGEIERIGEHGHLLGFESGNPEIINFVEVDGLFRLQTPHPIDFFKMASQEAGRLEGGDTYDIGLNTLYRSGDFSFVPTNFNPSGSFVLSSESDGYNNDQTKDDALIVKVDFRGKSQEVNILYREGFLPIHHRVDLGEEQTLVLSYGAAAVQTPFSIALEDFQLERYPGSESPSSYASEVVVIDGEERIPFRIYMNHVLDYKGFRFFQASYDTDELGTILSVNHDRLGSLLNYLGYLLMGIGMFFTLFSKSSRFSLLGKKLNKLQKKSTKAGAIIALFFTLTAHGQNSPETLPEIPQLVISQDIDMYQAEIFGRTLVQDLDGRIKPINTLASEFVRKISRKNYFSYPSSEGDLRLNVDQVFLGVHLMPQIWQFIPLIKVDFEALSEFEEVLNPGENGLVAFASFLDQTGNYRFAQEVEEANQKVPSMRNTFDKEILKVDERFNILYNLFSGNYLKIFPNKLDENQTWYSYTHDFRDFDPEDGAFAREVIPSYFNDLIQENYQGAIEKIGYIQSYQNILGADIIPSPEQLEAELFYNKVNLNFWLFQVYFTLGLLMLILAIVKIFKQTKVVLGLWDLVVVLILISFLCFTANLILRWYISGHAPWSNGYEMLIFVAWCLNLCGLLVYKKSDFALPLASLFTGALLFVSWLDWLSPEITNLMPVLKSYWLKVHVATIVSSYAPLALSAVLGLMALILSLFQDGTHGKIIETKIKELTYINEMSMTIGLFTLSVGTFLGGVWANESWGRYWAWDPKETWALISIIVYAIVLHLRFIPKLANRYTLNTASVIAFWSIIMTSFGVNYYLSGLHSYASGDPVPIPKFVYVVAALQLALILYSGYKVLQRKKTK